MKCDMRVSTGLLVALAALGSADCAKRGPRDVSNENPISQFPADLSNDATIGRTEPQGERVIAKPAAMGQKPRVIASASARALVTDAERVYFGDDDDDVLYTLPKADVVRDTPVRIARRAPMPGGLSFDAHDRTLAWIGAPGDIVLRIPVGGGTPTTVRDRGIFIDVVATGGDVFFTEARGTGGTLTRVTGNTAAHLADFEGLPRGIAVDGANVYLATSSRLVVSPRTRGEISELAKGAGFGHPVVDDTWLYATEVAPNSRARLLVRMKKSGGRLETIATGVRDAPIALHRGTVYWFDDERPALLSASMLEAPTSGFTPSVLADDPMLGRVGALAVDEDGAFVATGYGESGRIAVIPIP